MAYVPQQIPKEEENKFAPNFQTTANPVPPQVSGSAGEGGGGGRGAPGVGSSTQFGSNAAKLSDYLTANKDQAAGFGQQVAGDLSNRYNQTMGAIDQGAGSFGQQVNQGVSAPDQQKVNQAATNPADFAKDPENVKQFQSWYNEQYSGPQNFEGSGVYGDINNQVNKAVQNSSLVGSQAGLGTYLNNFMGANDTTEGMRTLDTALLLGNKDSSKAIRDAAAPYQNLNSYLGDKTQAANQSVQSAKQHADEARSQVQNRFTGQNGAIPTFQNDLTQRLAQARSGATTKADQTMAGLLNGGTATPAPTLQSLTDLGFDQGTAATVQDAIENLSGDYGQAFNPNLVTRNDPSAAFNLGNVANSDDYARAAALSQLTGQDLSGFLNPANANQAGTAPKSLLSIDNQSFQDATTNALRKNDVDTVSKVLAMSPAGLTSDSLRDPKILATFQSMLSGKDLQQFNNAVDRLRLTQSLPTLPTTPTTGGTGVMRAS